jgi:putative CocE/NonD family hydrolase
MPDTGLGSSGEQIIRDQPSSMSFRVETDVMVPMRDGEALATDVWIPDGGPSPTLLVRLPYGKNERIGAVDHPLIPNIHTLLQAGYAVVWQDCRGTFGSSGTFTPMVHEPGDGVDTIAWIVDQPGATGRSGCSASPTSAWCNGPSHHRRPRP